MFLSSSRLTPRSCCLTQCNCPERAKVTRQSFRFMWQVLHYFRDYRKFVRGVTRTSHVVTVCVCVHVLIGRVLSADEQSDEAAIPPAGSVSVLSERHSRALCELEERVNDLEQRANTIFTDNAQQQAEFTRLKERLVEALESEVNLHLL